MQFQYPGFLFALLTIAVPILIHLFNFRRYKKVYFTNIRFLKDIQEETKSKSRLKHLLILAARILTIGFLVLAFAQPYIPYSKSEKQSRSKLKSIYLDNSFSMDQVNTFGQLFNVAKQYTYQIVASSQGDAKFTIITNDANPSSQRLQSKESIQELVGQVSASSISNSFEKTYLKQKEVFKEFQEYSPELFLISDFQKTDENLSFLNDTTVTFHLIPVQGIEERNISIDSCWFNSPLRKTQQPETLHFSITNHSKKEVKDIQVKLELNGAVKTFTTIDIAPNSSGEFELNFIIDAPGIVEGKLAVEDYPITFDNAFYFAYNIPKTRVVSVISQQDTTAIFNPLYPKKDGFEIRQYSSNSINNKDLLYSNLVILNDINYLSSGLQNELINWVNQGGQLVVFPGELNSNSNLNNFMSQIGGSPFGKLDTVKTSVSKIEYEHPLYSEVFENQSEQVTLPKVSKHLQLLNAGNGARGLLALSNGEPFLLEQQIGLGKLYQFSVPTLDSYSNFAKHALFVVTLYQIAAQYNTINPLYYTFGNANYFKSQNVKNKEAVFELSSDEQRFIPETRNRGNENQFWFHDKINKAGIYKLVDQEKHIRSFAINYNAKESKTDFYTEEELQQMANSNDHIFLHTESFDQIGKKLNEIEFGKQLWQVMLVLALLMILFEIILIKFWKE